MGPRVQPGDHAGLVIIIRRLGGSPDVLVRVACEKKGRAYSPALKVIQEKTNEKKVPTRIQQLTALPVRIVSVA